MSVDEAKELLQKAKQIRSQLDATMNEIDSHFEASENPLITFGRTATRALYGRTEMKISELRSKSISSLKNEHLSEVVCMRILGQLNSTLLRIRLLKQTDQQRKIIHMFAGGLNTIYGSFTVTKIYDQENASTKIVSLKFNRGEPSCSDVYYYRQGRLEEPFWKDYYQLLALTGPKPGENIAHRSILKLVGLEDRKPGSILSPEAFFLAAQCAYEGIDTPESKTYAFELLRQLAETHNSGQYLMKSDLSKSAEDLFLNGTQEQLHNPSRALALYLLSSCMEPLFFPPVLAIREFYIQYEDLAPIPRSTKVIDNFREKLLTLDIVNGDILLRTHAKTIPVVRYLYAVCLLFYWTRIRDLKKAAKLFMSLAPLAIVKRTDEQEQSKSEAIISGVDFIEDEEYPMIHGISLPAAHYRLAYCYRFAQGVYYDLQRALAHGRAASLDLPRASLFTDFSNPGDPDNLEHLAKTTSLQNGHSAAAVFMIETYTQSRDLPASQRNTQTWKQVAIKMGCGSVINSAASRDPQSSGISVEEFALYKHAAQVRGYK